MGRNSGNVFGDAVNAFYGTYLALDERKTRKEDSEQERRYKEFYMKLQGNADDRAAESHKASMEEWDAKQEEMLREAEARAEFLAANGQTFESWSMLKPVEQFEMQRQTWEMSKEMNALQLETGRFSLSQSKALAPLELEGARLRNRASALGGSGGRGGLGEVDGALEDKYKLLNFQQKSIEDRLQQYATKDPLTGATAIDWGRVPEPLMKSYEANSQAMTDLESRMIPLQREQLGLGAGAPMGGPGSSEVQTPADPMGAFLSNNAPQRASGVAAEQKAASERSARLSDLGRKRSVYVNPLDGTLTATDDVKVVENAKRLAESQGKAFEVFNGASIGAGGEVVSGGEIPTWAIGKPMEEYRRYLKEKEKGRVGISAWGMGPGGVSGGGQY